MKKRTFKTAKVLENKGLRPFFYAHLSLSRSWKWFCFFARFLIDYNYIRITCFLTNDR